MPDPRLDTELGKVVGNPNTASLSVYLEDNYQWVLDKRRIGTSWEAITQTLNNLGLRAAQKRPLTAKTVQASFARLQKRLDQRRAQLKHVGRPPQSATQATAGYVHSSKRFGKE